VIRVYHVNFHTSRNRPVFLAEDADQTIREIIGDVIARHHIACLAFEVMPTHVHAIVVVFPDADLGRTLNLLKDASARAFFLACPEFRADLGEHLWTEGYSLREIVSHDQFARTVDYVRDNRRKGGLAA
jgi:REP element-mobilizing transposase RayT